MRIRWIVLLILISLIPAGCGSSRPAQVNTAPQNPKVSASDVTITNTPENQLESNKTLESEEMPSPPPDEDKLVNLAIQDLADRLKIDLAEITLMKTTEITWPNISAGCNPDPGQILTKGRVYGYRVWLAVGSDEYIYHIGDTGQVILCPRLNPGVNNPLLQMTPDSNETPQSSGK